MHRCLPLVVLLLCGAAAAQSPNLKPEYDVVIAGAGTGGFGAAVQAARLGASVLLLEETDWIGGQANAAAVTSMDEGRTLVRQRGLYRELVERVERHYEALGKTAETAYWGGHIGFEPRVGRKLFAEMLREAGQRSTLEVALCSRVTKVLKQGDAVTGVEIETVTPRGKSTHAVRSKVLIDATEWGDVIPHAGARYRVGNCTNEAIDPKRKIQMLTWTAVIRQYPRGVPEALVLRQPPPGYKELQKHFAGSLVDGEQVGYKQKPWQWATFVGYRGMPDSAAPGDWPPVTRTHMNFNNDYPVYIGDVEDPAQRWTTCKAAILRTLNLLYYVQQTLGKKDWSVADDEGFDSPYQRSQVERLIADMPDLAPFKPVLLHFSIMPYVRESRRIVGLHTLCAPEIERYPGKPRQFETTVALGDYGIDLHGSMTAELLEKGLDRPEDMPREFGHRGVGPFAIPFECFIPEKLDGFLAAEKNISQSRLANGATRLQPSTMLMGQAAGAIAALAVKNALRPRDLDPVLVQGVLLDGHSTLQIMPLVDVAQEGWEWKPIQLVTVQGMLPPADGKFSPASPVTAEELRTIAERLGGKADDTATVTRGSLARVLVSAGNAAKVKLQDDRRLTSAEEPLTRLEAAQVIAQFLEQRATARLTGRVQTFSWSAARAATPIPPGDSDRVMRRCLEMLERHAIIDSPDYWFENAVAGRKFDGGKAADLVLRAARVFKPEVSLAHAPAVLAEHHVIGQPDYWAKNAVPGGKCDGKSMATLIHNLARELRKIPAARK